MMNAAFTPPTPHVSSRIPWASPRPLTNGIRYVLVQNRSSRENSIASNPRAPSRRNGRPRPRPHASSRDARTERRPQAPAVRRAEVVAGGRRGVDVVAVMVDAEAAVVAELGRVAVVLVDARQIRDPGAHREHVEE